MVGGGVVLVLVLYSFRVTVLKLGRSFVYPAGVGVCECGNEAGLLIGKFMFGS